jgi:anti-anti-sigma factor
VLDLRGLSFMDSSGLHFLVELHEHAARDGFELRLVAPPAPVDTPIRLCGLDQHLPFMSDLPADGLAA